MAYPTDDLPTVPVVYASELPRCVGACSQGRQPCAHPLACGVQTADETEWADIQAELTLDQEPVDTPDVLAAAFAQLDPPSPLVSPPRLLAAAIALAAMLAALSQCVPHP